MKCTEDVEHCLSRDAEGNCHELPTCGHIKRTNPKVRKFIREALRKEKE